MHLFDPSRPLVNGLPGLVGPDGANLNSIVPMPYCRVLPGAAVEVSFFAMVNPASAACFSYTIPQKELSDYLDAFRENPEKVLSDLGWTWKNLPPASPPKAKAPEIDLDDLLKDF